MTTTTSTHPPTTVLVIGGTGRTGRLVVTGLLERGVGVRALVRTPLSAALPLGVEVVPGDLDDPASVDRAARGADAAFLMWHTFSAEGAAAVVAALATHVRHVVYLSAADLLADGADRPTAGVWADIEGLLERAPVTHTFVRGGGFASNTLQWAGQVRDGDTVRLPFPDAARSLVDERDLADLALRGLLDPGLEGAAPVATGPATLTQTEQVQAIGAALGRDLVVEEQPVEEARAVLTAQHGDGHAEAVLSHLRTLTERPEPPRDDVREVLGRPAHTFADWAAHHAEDFRRLTVG